jgi:hypothetical protein
LAENKPHKFKIGFGIPLAMSFGMKFVSLLSITRQVHPMAYHHLSSEKYWLESFTQEQERISKAKRKIRFRTFMINGLATVLVLALVSLTIRTMPQWLPPVVEFLK